MKIISDCCKVKAIIHHEPLGGVYHQCSSCGKTCHPLNQKNMVLVQDTKAGDFEVDPYDDSESSILVKSTCLRLTVKNRERMDILQKRMEWLDLRIKEAAGMGKTLGFDIKESKALHWAIDYIEAGDTIYLLLARWMAEEMDRLSKIIKGNSK